MVRRSVVESDGMMVPVDAQATAPTTATVARGVLPVWSGALLYGLLFLPGALGFMFEEISFAAGTALTALGALALVTIAQIPMSARDFQMSLVVTGVASFAITIHLLIADAVSGDAAFDIGRAMLSLVLFGVVFLAVPPISEALMSSGRRLVLLAGIACSLFALSAILGILGIQPATASLGAKPTFPFTEPSFLGFSVPAMLIFLASRSTLVVRVALILAALALGYALSNFTVIAAVALVAAMTLPLAWLGTGITLLIVSAASLDLSYYLDRLDFDWASSTNLSSLVYVQGWQMLNEALARTSGWGLGFQQLGVGYTNVPATFRINALLGRDANLQDGGFVLSKLGGEFGVIGLVLVVAYLWMAGRSILIIRKASSRGTILSDGELFARACIIGYLIELFVRGTNYFTGTFVLMLAGVRYLYRHRQSRAQLLVLRA